MIDLYEGSLILFAAGMAVTTALLVRSAAESRRVMAGAVVLFLFSMMTAMLVGALLYLANPGRASLLEGLWIAGGAMSVIGLPLLRILVREANARETEGAGFRPPTIRRRWIFGVSILGAVVLNEFLMSWAFQLAAGASTSSAAGSISLALVHGVNSPWFVFPMALEMALSAILLRAVLPRAFVGLLIAQSIVMTVSPPAFVDPTGRLWAIGLASAGMIGVIVFVMEYLYRHRQLQPVLSGYFLALMSIYAVMMAGLYLWIVYGAGFLFASAVLLEMALFLDAVVRPDRFSEGTGLPWQLRPNWTFGVLAAIFVGELFMGAVLDVALEPSVYGGGFPSLALSGGVGSILYGAVYNGFWFTAAVTGSTWFLVMMGVEMGTLVAFKFRETVSRENKVRLGLMLGSYAVFATFFPSFYYSALFPNAPTGTAVPVLGWNMGLGSAPIVPSMFLVLFLTYAITGSLAVLFGRRVVCGVFCTAPVMYQGTTFDASSSFNRSSPLARKYLGSRLSSIYSTTTGVTMASLVAVSFLSYFDQKGQISVTFLGADPSVFFFSLAFGVLWFVLFVTIPYTGNYNCVTMGWCYTGHIAAAFGRIGFFKLKVRDREVCRRCTTLDCAKKCPVGLVDMPGHFRKFGEFRSSKCCGVGNCVDACPYGNLYIHDVRHWLAQRFARPRDRSITMELPMARAHGPISGTTPAGRALVPDGTSRVVDPARGG
ncbi:MAG: hypothetical protein L3K19_08340 [Thermoplasmata archaeon]|nr:hypothetical protein [Thermoplasmata archaeon]